MTPSDPQPPRRARSTSTTPRRRGPSRRSSSRRSTARSTELGGNPGRGAYSMAVDTARAIHARTPRHRRASRRGGLEEPALPAGLHAGAEPDAVRPDQAGRPRGRVPDRAQRRRPPAQRARIARRRGRARRGRRGRLRRPRDGRGAAAPRPRRARSSASTPATSPARSSTSPTSPTSRTSTARSCSSTARRPAATSPSTSRTLGADAWACSGHKGLLGPQGVGVLYLAPGLRARRARLRRQRPRRERAPDRPAACARTATRRARPTCPASWGWARRRAGSREHGAEQREHETALVRRLVAGVSALPGYRILGPGPDEPRVPVVSVVHEHAQADQLAFALDRRYGVAVRSGLHCAPWAHTFARNARDRRAATERRIRPDRGRRRPRDRGARCSRQRVHPL